MIPNLTGKTKCAGVMGWPVEHSKSPRLHNYWLSYYGIDGVYVPLPVKPENLKAALKGLAALGFSGANLTIPHKEEAMQYVDSIDDLARRAGAINTIIVKEDGKLEGRNTDVYGFMMNLKQAGYAPSTFLPTATILGAGGASRAILVALQEMGVKEIAVVNRHKDRAEQLVASLKGNTKTMAHGWNDIPALLEKTGLFVNTTSLGMVGQPELQIDLSPMPQGSWVTDAVYAPLETELLKQAKNKGLHVVDGLGMLLYQAVPAFQAWFGQEPEVTPALRKHILDAP